MSDKDSVARTLLVAALLCVVCSVLVSTAAVELRPFQKEQKARDRKVNILEATGLYDRRAKGASEVNIEELFAKRIEAKVIDFASGEFVDDIDPVTYEQRKAAADPAQSVAIPEEEDLGGIHRRAKHGIVYLVRDDAGALEQVVLPIHGKGLWSTLYGFLALEADLNTVQGVTFYEHGETPGLGGEVDNPRWKAKWKGKKVFGDGGEVRIEALKGVVNPESSTAIYQVDGLAGATITTRGVTNLVRYWLDQHGYGPFLERVRQRTVPGQQGH